MKYEKIKSLNDIKFRRLTGVKITTFNKMVEILKEANKKKKSKGGRNNSLCIEDMLIMSLEYLREYRTYFHIAQNYFVSESTAYKTVKWVEETLIKHKDFSLPGKKSLLKSDNEIEVILVDVTESPIERPKKNRNYIIQEKRKNIQ